MMNLTEITRISKFLSLVLRHKPETIGIQLDENGWADVASLIEKTNRLGQMTLDNATLHYIVENNSKKRFAFNDTFDKIRASQGHSIEIELGYQAQQPPPILYHGTSDNAVASILESGIQKRSRQHVHLSHELDTASKVGQRHGKPFIFQVFAAQMFNDGFAFYLSDNGVWLTDNIPSKYFQPYK